MVILTAKADEESQLRGWEGGVLDYLTKPFTPMALSPVVERALAGRDPEEEERRRGVIMKRLQLLREMRQAEEGRHGT